MKKKILLIETEITDTGGHFFDNLIEYYYSFKTNLMFHAF